MSLKNIYSDENTTNKIIENQSFYQKPSHVKFGKQRPSRLLHVQVTITNSQLIVSAVAVDHQHAFIGESHVIH